MYFVIVYSKWFEWFAEIITNFILVAANIGAVKMSVIIVQFKQYIRELGRVAFACFSRADLSSFKIYILCYIYCC